MVLLKSLRTPKTATTPQTHAMAGAKALHLSPRKIADVLCANLALEGSYFASAEIAGLRLY